MLQYHVILYRDQVTQHVQMRPDYVLTVSLLCPTVSWMSPYFVLTVSYCVLLCLCCVLLCPICVLMCPYCDLLVRSLGVPLSQFRGKSNDVDLSREVYKGPLLQECMSLLQAHKWTEKNLSLTHSAHITFLRKCFNIKVKEFVSFDHFWMGGGPFLHGGWRDFLAKKCFLLFDYSNKF